ncbi:MAG: oxidoreductase [Gammaproteobacteria bacterium]|nr:oxidoreductase [Gammaproteobacteria bacterium]
MPNRKEKPLLSGKPDIPDPPQKPEPLECCGGGCYPCVFDYYYDQLAEWEQRHGILLQEWERREKKDR